jgi:hypothetical protein
MESAKHAVHSSIVKAGKFGYQRVASALKNRSGKKGVKEERRRGQRIAP